MTRRLLCGKGFRQDKACGCIQLLRITYHYQYAGNVSRQVFLCFPKEFSIIPIFWKRVFWVDFLVLSFLV